MWIPAGPSASTAIRVAMAQSAPTASRTAASVSSQNRALSFSGPPYPSVRLL